jgi:hypothetical protein
MYTRTHLTPDQSRVNKCSASRAPIEAKKVINTLTLASGLPTRDHGFDNRGTARRVGAATGPCSPLESPDHLVLHHRQHWPPDVWL